MSKPGLGHQGTLLGFHTYDTPCAKRATVVKETGTGRAYWLVELTGKRCRHWRCGHGAGLCGAVTVYKMVHS